MGCSDCAFAAGLVVTASVTARAITGERCENACLTVIKPTRVKNYTTTITMPRTLTTGRLRRAATILLLLASISTAGLTSGCQRAKDPTLIGTFRMGERVQAGPLIYTVLEAEWKTQLEGSGRMPANRFLFIRVSITNSSGAAISAPAFTLLGAGGKTYEELTEGLDEVRNWLNILRTIAPAQTEQGYVIFDAPVGAYKMVLSDAGEVGNEKHAHVDIPVHLE